MPLATYCNQCRGSVARLRLETDTLRQPRRDCVTPGTRGYLFLAVECAQLTPNQELRSRGSESGGRCNARIPLMSLPPHDVAVSSEAVVGSSPISLRELASADREQNLLARFLGAILPIALSLALSGLGTALQRRLGAGC